MKVVKKLLAPVLVVGLLLTSLVSLHHLKDNKKSNVLRIGISHYITHKSLDATRKGFIAELKKAGYVDGKNIQIDFQNAQGEQRNLKNISKQLSEESDLVFAIATLLKVWPIQRKQHRLSSQLLQIHWQRSW